MNKAFRFQLIEIPVVQNLAIGGIVKVPDQPELRTQTSQIIILHQICSFDVITNPVTPTGAAVATVANYAGAYLVLNINGTQTQYQIPLSLTNYIATTDTSVQRPYVNTPYELPNITKVDWSKSFIQVGAAVTAGVTFLLGVWYTKLPDDERQTAPTPNEFPIVS